MNYSLQSIPFRRALHIALLLLIGIVALGNSVAYASGLCVNPTGAGKCFTSIQDAVDAANTGDQITIRAGLYVEQVSIIGKDLTLVGRSGAVIQAPADMEDTVSPIAGAEGRPIILVTDAEVTIRGLTIDGASSAANNPFLEGIAFINAGGVIRDNLVKNIGFEVPTLPIINGVPRYQGQGMLVANLAAVPRTVTIAENKVVNYNSSGITIFAEADPNNPDVANLTVHVIDNTIIGLGPNDVIDQWGIFFGGYRFTDPQFSITGTLKGNRIRDQITVPPFPGPSVGIATLSTYNMEIADNTIENVNIGITAIQAFNAQIAKNRVIGPVQEPFGYTGLILSGSNSQVTENRLKELGAGIMLFVDDPAYGSAINSALDENRFENVAVDLMTGPGASPGMASMDTEAGQAPNTWERHRFFPLP